MPRPDADVEEHLQSALSRIREAVAPAPARKTGSELEARRAAKRARRARKARRAKPKAIVAGSVALVALYVSLVVPSLWWLVFVALGFGAAAALQVLRLGLAWASGLTPEELEAPAVGTRGKGASAADEEPRVARVRELCAELLAIIETGPAVLRRVVQRPKETIEGLRDAFVATAARERELRAALGTGDARLAADREALERRVAAETDPVIRGRLAEALRALDEQLEHRAELARAAARLEAESTRILYTLESLRMQLLRARSSADEDSGADQGQVRQTLESLSLEIDAIAEALERAPAPAPAQADAARWAAAQARTESR